MKSQHIELYTIHILNFLVHIRTRDTWTLILNNSLYKQPSKWVGTEVRQCTSHPCLNEDGGCYELRGACWDKGKAKWDTHLKKTTTKGSGKVGKCV